jgi:type IV secretory pathway TraG/TraD family ATPase VirD4
MLAVENNGQKQADLMQESDMEKEHFVETGRNSFSGDYLYDQIVPEDHFYVNSNNRFRGNVLPCALSSSAMMAACMEVRPLIQP